MTGKCREDFEKFLIGFLMKEESETRVTAKLKVASFYSYPIEMQFGVIQAFGDSVDMKIMIEPSLHNLYYIYIFAPECIGTYKLDDNTFTSRNKAQEEAIKHFNKIYNNEKI